ncbi:hypothetical protein BJ878DRAFT_310941 [Calycina marina]|uniref:C2H2-type domain-containing protein n=1 Tax=Calycina marina TaxID=1763456 RepID=A0A9P7Z6F1_9HELO|nr:hypothetical protein BJ878DRAFT_310941 [Calycina marina]
MRNFNRSTDSDVSGDDINNDIDITAPDQSVTDNIPNYLNLPGGHIWYPRQSRNVESLVTSTPQSRAMVTPQYALPQYGSSTSAVNYMPPLCTPSQHNPFYSTSTSELLVPLPAFFLHHPPERGTTGASRTTQIDPYAESNDIYGRNARQGHSKQEPVQSWTSMKSTPISSADNPQIGIFDLNHVENQTDDLGNTEVDRMMRELQAKLRVGNHTTTFKPESVAGVSETHLVNCIPHGDKLYPWLTTRPQGDVSSLAQSAQRAKPFTCGRPKCGKRFIQKTHLEIHDRKHTGAKPYSCPFDNCNRWFSQQGNLKTHIRRHTGDKPYQCDICGKLFAQRGNVTAHQATHTKARPFVCQLKKCDKTFTQRGNLKSHMNKFHADDIRELTTKIASVNSLDYVTEDERQLWQYLAVTYKNANKGIKGRGRERDSSIKDAKPTALQEMEIARMRMPPYSSLGQDIHQIEYNHAESYNSFEHMDVEHSSKYSASSYCGSPLYDNASDGSDGYDSGNSHESFGDHH